MLPFIDQKKIGSAMVNLRKADGTQRYEEGGQVKEEESSGNLEGVAQELIDAVMAKDAKAVAVALQAAFNECESEGMEEYEEPMEGEI
jgi:hypothetical protein